LHITQLIIFFFVSSRRRHTRSKRDWSSDVCSSDLKVNGQAQEVQTINLASTCNNETLINNKIAPGTEGAFNIIVDGTGSDVGIEDRKSDVQGKRVDSGAERQRRWNSS